MVGTAGRISRSSDIWLDYVVRERRIQRTIVLGSLVCLLSTKLRQAESFVSRPKYGWSEEDATLLGGPCVQAVQCKVCHSKRIQNEPSLFL